MCVCCTRTHRTVARGGRLQRTLLYCARKAGMRYTPSAPDVRPYTSIHPMSRYAPPSRVHLGKRYENV